MSLDGRFEPQVAKQISQPGEPPRRMASGRLDPRGTSRRTAWLLDPVSNVSAPVHAALIGDLDLSLAGIAASLLNFFLLNGICCLLSREPLFFGFLAGNFFLSGLRLAALLLVRKGDAAKQLWRTDFYVFITLVWCLFEGALTGAALLFSNAPMEVLGTAGALAPQAALAARNFPAPRFAMAIILCLDVPFVFGATFGPDRWLIALTVLTPGYLFATMATIKRFQKLLIENYVNQFASKRQACHDPLTGILNRRGINEALETGVDKRFTLFAMDLDGFKQINDTHGHAAGDVLLQMVTSRLHEVARKDDLLARLGGDEFVLIAPGLGPAAAVAVAERIVAAISAPDYPLYEGVTVRIGVSVGYACAPEDGGTLQGLSERADAALYAVKQRGKGGWQRAEGTVLLPVAT